MRWCSPPPKSPNLGRFEPPSSTCLSSTAFSAPPAAMAWGCDRESTLSPKSPSQRAPFKIFWRIASNSPGCIGNPRRRPPATSRRRTQFRNTRILQPSSKIVWEGGCHATAQLGCGTTSEFNQSCPTFKLAPSLRSAGPP